MNKIEILSLLAYLCVAGLFIYAWQTAGTKRNWKNLILPVTLTVLATIFTISKNVFYLKILIVLNYSTAF